MIKQHHVGQLVWYYPDHAKDDLPTAAIVITVVSDELVDLCVFGKEGHLEPVVNVCSVPFIETGGDPPLDTQYCTCIVEKPEHKVNHKEKHEEEPEEHKAHGHKKHHA